MNKNPVDILIDALGDIQRTDLEESGQRAFEALKKYREAEKEPLKIHILFDYDDKPIKASFDGRKLEDEAKESNGGKCWPYYVCTFDIE